MKHLLWALAVAAVLFALDRLALWAERRGWLYYRYRKPGRGSIGNALLQVQAILEPSKQYVLEERVKERTEEQDSGDPPPAPTFPSPRGPRAR